MGHELSKEVFPSNFSFWATWAFCPQVINLKILRTHFTAHTWLNWTYFSLDVYQIIQMIIQPRAHIKAIPLKCVCLLGLWGFRAMWLKLLGEATAKTLEKWGSYLTLAYFPIFVAMDAGFVCAMGYAVWNGELSKNPLQWE